MKRDKVAILLSGGQDSTTCLLIALDSGRDVAALTVNYGQRHAVELQSARDVVEVCREWYPHLRIEHEELDVGQILASTSPLVSEAPLGQYASADDLPGGVEPTFVPGRNLLFLTLLANRAAKHGCQSMMTGVCQADFGGYPDCRRDFIDATEAAIAQGFVGEGRWIPIETPLMDLTKADSVKLGAKIPGFSVAMSKSHTCYAGVRPGCGRCHACLLRARGFLEAGVQDPLFGGGD